LFATKRWNLRFEREVNDLEVAEQEANPFLRGLDHRFAKVYPQFS
jgi:hypothetical protein